jgi:hypothetical protein
LERSGTNPELYRSTFRHVERRRMRETKADGRFSLLRA